MIFRAVCNTALSEWKHPEKFSIWKCSVYKVILSKERVDSESLKRVVFKTHPKPRISCQLVGLFALVWMKMQIHSLPLGAAFGAAHRNAVHKAYRHDEMNMRPIEQSPQISVTQRKGLEKWIVEQILGSRWASKLKLNAYYKKIKVVFDHGCISTCCWGLPKPKYESYSAAVCISDENRRNHSLLFADELLQLEKRLICIQFIVYAYAFYSLCDDCFKLTN